MAPWTSARGRAHDEPERRRAVGVAGVALLRAVREGQQAVHLGPQLDVIARLRAGWCDTEASVLTVLEIHEHVEAGVVLEEVERKPALGHRPFQVVLAVGGVPDAVAEEVRLLA